MTEQIDQNGKVVETVSHNQAGFLIARGHKKMECDLEQAQQKKLCYGRLH